MNPAKISTRTVEYCRVCVGGGGGGVANVCCFPVILIKVNYCYNLRTGDGTVSIFGTHTSLKMLFQTKPSQCDLDFDL